RDDAREQQARRFFVVDDEDAVARRALGYQSFTHGPEYRTGPVGAPVLEPPAGSRLTASIGTSASAWSATAASCSTPLSLGTSPSERGLPPRGSAHSSRLAFGTWMDGSSALTRSWLSLRPALT